MTVERACLFPNGLKHKEAGHQTQMYPSPFCFVPDKIQDKEEGGEHLLKSIVVKRAPKSTMKVVSRHFTNIKTFLLHQ